MSATDQTRGGFADELWRATTERTPVAPLTDRDGNLDIEDAYAIQTAVTDKRLAAGARIVGRKVGLTSKPMQELLGVSEPDFGVLFDDMVVEDGDEIDLSTLLQPRVEAELAFVMDRDLAGPGVNTATALQAIGAVFPAIEVVDSRIADWKIKLVDTVADNASSGMAVIGDWHDAEDVRVEQLGVSLALGPECVRGRGDAVLGHPAEAVAWLAGILAQSGERLEPGDIVLPGSVARAVPIAAGQAAYATFDRLGEVSVGLV